MIKIIIISEKGRSAPNPVSKLKDSPQINQLPNSSDSWSKL